LRYWFFPKILKRECLHLPPGKILIAWLNGTPRFTELVLPLLQELKRENCLVLYGNQNVVPLVPDSVHCISWDQVLSYVEKDWREEYNRCKSEWAFRIKSICREYKLPMGASEDFVCSMMISSQQVSGCIAFLKEAKPAVIVTDYDRNALWSCLVLAAKLVGVPTVTLVHGVIPHDALGFSPALADKIICWGEFEHEKLLAAGEPPEKIIIGGCSRLSRDLSVSESMNSIMSSLDPEKPVVMFMSCPEFHRLELVDSFCAGVQNLELCTGIVRLHPSEKAETYAAIMERYPEIIFFESNQVSLDDSFASSDVVVVGGSSAGSDALVKRRPLVVFDFMTVPSGDTGNIIKFAGCPHARTPEELTEILRRILLEETYRSNLSSMAERYVEKLCNVYGGDAVRMTADIVRQVVNS